MVMQWLIHEWIARLMLLRSRLHSARGRSTRTEPDAWFLAIRERILSFLVARYREQPMETESRGQRESGGATGEAIGFGDADEYVAGIAAPPITMCAVEPEDAPPRQRTDLGPLLRSIRVHNEANRPRWRWWL